MMNNVEVFRHGHRHTPEQILLDALAESDNITAVHITFRTEDGYVHSCWSDDTTLNLIGMLEAAKDRQLNRMYDAAESDVNGESA